MASSLGIWHLVLQGGEEKDIIPPTAVQITNISYGEEIADASSRGVVKLTFQSISTQDEDEDDKGDDSESGLTLATTVLCALSPGKIEQASVNLLLEEEMGYRFNLTGKNTVYLTGNYIDQGHDQDPFDSDNSDSDSEDAYDLREVSSDVEMHPDDLDGIESDASRFEEVTDEPSKSQKRPRESDATGGAGEEKAGKAEKKTKKLKGEGGKAVDVEAAPTQKDEKKKEKKKKEKGGEQGESKEEGKEKEKHTKKTVAGGVVIQDAKIGTGPMAKKGNTVRMRYVGKLTNGKEFDKNTSGKPFTFHLGKDEVIKGWDEGIVGMQVGGERVLTIPPKMGYGGRAQKGIPANSTLVFDVKLLEIK